MLDIKFIRENKELVKEGARKKRIDFDVEELVIIDDKRRALLGEIEKMRTEHNQKTSEIQNVTNEDDRNNLISFSKALKEELQKKEDEFKKIMIDWKRLMILVPNIPDASVPDGATDEDNKEVRTWGEKPDFSFTPKDHIEIMTKLDMVDFERGAKVAGFRGYFLKNDGVLLSNAIFQAAYEHFLKKEFTPMIVPSMVRRENFLGTGYLPQGEEDLYRTQDGDYLAGTSEVATMGYHMDEVLKKEELPKKFLSFSTCFRREAGSHGKDVKGLIRVHEFYKLEQVILCEANHEMSVKLHEELNRNMEEFIESLGLPYRRVINSSGDLGLGQVKKYDIELWVPLEEKYREIGSASYFHDFQTRRLNIRYKDENDKMRFAHSLNSTAIPVPRILVSLIENYQQEDGSVKVPEILQKYIGKDTINLNV
jgi:seryl-tRNA synthetase